MTQYIDLNDVYDGQELTSSSMNEIIQAIRQLQDTTPAQVLEKCEHCGQWGAVMCACPSCGAPIDPKPNNLSKPFVYRGVGVGNYASS